jgi:hypothetical protein
MRWKEVYDNQAEQFRKEKVLKSKLIALKSKLGGNAKKVRLFRKRKEIARIRNSTTS